MGFWNFFRFSLLYDYLFGENDREPRLFVDEHQRQFDHEDLTMRHKELSDRLSSLEEKMAEADPYDEYLQDEINDELDEIDEELDYLDMDIDDYENEYF